MKKIILSFVGFLLLAVNVLESQIPGTNFFQETWQPKYFESPSKYKNSEFLTGAYDANVKVFLYDSINPVLPIHLGVNTTFRSGHSMLDRVKLYNNSGWGVYRFPAGSGSNTYFWGNDIPDTFKIKVSPIKGASSNYLTPEDFVNFIKTTGSNGTVVVNYFYARYGVVKEDTSRSARVKQAAEYAAGFVRKLNVEYNGNIK